MWSVSSRFLAALRGPHRARTQVDAYYANGITAADLPLTDGTITADRGSTIRRQASLTFADPSLYPARPDDPLSPYGTELHITRVMVYGDGTEEPVDLGRFRVDSCELTDDGTISVDGSDRSALVADAAFTTPYSVPTTVPIVETITALLMAAAPYATVTVTASRALDRPGPTTYDEDRLEAVTDLATAIGAEVYAEVDGSFLVRDTPDLATTPPSWTVDAGERGVQVALTRGQAREDVCNAVIIRSDDATGETDVWQYETYDTDPASPTRWGGPFGRVPRFHSSPAISTVDQAAAAAASLLRESLGIARAVDLSMVPNWALEPGDVISVQNEDHLESHLIETLTIPLTVSGSMQATTRANTYWLSTA